MIPALKLSARDGMFLKKGRKMPELEETGFKLLSALGTTGPNTQQPFFDLYF